MHVPGWHARTKARQDAGTVQMVGVVQEQHPDRARLFMQWQQMGWPVLVDALNLLEVGVVPITLAIDEHGIIRHTNLRASTADKLERIFLNHTYPAPPNLPPPAQPSSHLDTLRPDEESTNAGQWARYADAMFLWGGADRVHEALAGYRHALAAAPDNGPFHFRLGVAYRKRYDSPGRQPDDFARAVAHWRKALDIDPNQYIWRRRIQQYGPRLDKPYPFYDWVREARATITARGGTPVPLAVEPRGSEFASPRRSFAGATPHGEPPDAQGRITRDTGEFIRIESTVVHDTKRRRAAARVHLVFRPNQARKVHWNNEAEDLVVWIEPPDGWEVDRQLLSLPNPPAPVSTEPRMLEFELRGPRTVEVPPPEIAAYALYYVCEDRDGTCVYRRQDWSFTPAPPAP